MPQPQSEIPLRLLDESVGLAQASGNNAAWLCLCKKAKPLLGHTCSVERGENDRVDCGCGKKFFVIGEGQRFSKAIEVLEVA